jgi:phosphoglycerate dehydrogenase-like enzyme
MIAVAAGSVGTMVAARLQLSLDIGPGEIVVLSGDETNVGDSEVLLVGDIDREQLVGLMSSRIRWVHLLSTGVDGFPFDLVEDRVLTCSRGASAVAISEFVLAAMLAFEKHLPEQWISSEAEWRDADLGQLSGRTLGIVGLGEIGTATAHRALGFGMEVLAFRRTSAPPQLSGITIVPALDHLLGASDHVVIAAPATPATRHLIGAHAFGAMKNGVHLVNVSRGTLVDQDALLAALDSGQVAMATLDVTDPEPLPEGHRLYSHPRARVSPHVSWSSPLTARRSIELFEKNFRNYQSGDPLSGIVDKDEGY